MTMPGPNDDTQVFTVEYDGETGEVLVNNFGVHEAITVRQSLIDAAVRHAAIVELEKLGYTVLSPESKEID